MIPVDGLSHSEQSALDALVKVWESKLPRNILRGRYYDQKNLFKNLGIAVPPEMTNLEVAMGWPAKAVDLLALRCRPDKFVAPGMDVADLGIPELWRQNEMDIELPQAIRSSLMYSPSFLAVTPGDVLSGEPAVLITPASAMYSAGIWDTSKRAVTSAMKILATDDFGAPVGITMWLPGVTVTMARTARAWSVSRIPHSLEYVPVFPLPYKPSLERPFGSSRISRAVISITDSGMRTGARTELSAEFFSAPQRWIMGADEKVFLDEDGNPKTAWQSLIGKVWAAPPIADEDGYSDGKLPVVGEFRASPQTPNTDHMRALATQFAGETSLPVSSLGVIQDNPSSADAMLAAERDLILEALANVHDPMGSRIERAMLAALQIRDGLDEIPAEWHSVAFKWKNPETMTESAAADAVSKLVAAIPELAHSRVTLERLGWDESTVERAWSDMQRARGGSALDRILDRRDTGDAAVEPGPELQDTQEQKANR